MPAPSFGRHSIERSPSFRDVEKRRNAAQGKCSLSRHLQRVYPLSIHKSSSSLTLSSLSLSQNSNDSSLNSSVSSLDRRINAVSFRGMFRCFERREFGNYGREFESGDDGGYLDYDDDVVVVEEVRCVGEDGSLKRCNWITKTSDEVYVSFHDKCWGVPVFNDSRLFELLALSGMLIDHNWTEILKRREQYREVFANFDHHVVAKMDEKDIMEISSNKELILAESRVRCVVDNAKCIQKVAKEFGSFSGYIWAHVNHRPMINKHKHPRSIPLRTPKSEAISKDLVRRGFRLVGPVIVYSFMQAAGMAIDHLADCFRFHECVRLAQRSWGMTNVAM
ncbi:uncharacterized protein A4U43_C05F22380 [Asparagus officinalis]|uniref:DNA-3-methyladenine glycosylase I n=1 Tax=Asparagus officinalis TaxID=4686 RepID=A0A5P1ETT1_ASPOF|nr:uncharacterized protein LOC109843077 [Asparagus officinalis]ONK69392.1 uncharacterized protein A4U43_C05F22380 [Asparagus officinalis]